MGKLGELLVEYEMGCFKIKYNANVWAVGEAGSEIY